MASSNSRGTRSAAKAARATGTAASPAATAARSGDGSGLRAVGDPGSGAVRSYLITGKAGSKRVGGLLVTGYHVATDSARQNGPRLDALLRNSVRLGTAPTPDAT